jgi:hypothetical protein
MNLKTYKTISSILLISSALCYILFFTTDYKSLRFLGSLSLFIMFFIERKIRKIESI